MLSNNRIKDEIKAVKEAITKLLKLQEDSKLGIEVNKIVLKAFEDELK